MISVAAGIAMVGMRNAFALKRRDEVVLAAQSSEIIVADRGGDHIRAAVLDFAANLVLGGVTSTLFGLAVVGSYPIVAYSGWIGGIVSVDARHESRRADPRQATYYLVTLVIQLIPYSNAGGMGVYVGVDAWRALRNPRSDSWLGFSKDRLRDVAHAYVIVIPLFLVASQWEFLVR